MRGKRTAARDKAAIPNVGCVGMAEDRICFSKGHQGGEVFDSVSDATRTALEAAARSERLDFSATRPCWRKVDADFRKKCMVLSLRPVLSSTRLRATIFRNRGRR